MGISSKISGNVKIKVINTKKNDSPNRKSMCIPLALLGVILTQNFWWPRISPEYDGNCFPDIIELIIMILLITTLCSKL